jgi:hypothetical protein
MSVNDIIQQEMEHNILRYKVDACTLPVRKGERLGDKHSSPVVCQSPAKACVQLPSLPFWQMRQAFIDAWPVVSNIVFQFTKERNWLDKYTVDLVAESLFTEVGEMCSVIEWIDTTSSNIASVRERVAMEVADVCIYLFHMARITNCNPYNAL